MMRTPDGHGRIELTKYRNPGLVDAEPANAPPNTLGLRQIMFAIDDLEDTVARLRAHGAAPVGETFQYEDRYRLCYLRGPAGVIVALAATERSPFEFWTRTPSIHVKFLRLNGRSVDLAENQLIQQEIEANLDDLRSNRRKLFKFRKNPSKSRALLSKRGKVIRDSLRNHVFLTNFRRFGGTSADLAGSATKITPISCRTWPR